MVVVSSQQSGARREIRFNVRAPVELHGRLVDRALANGRSMNSEIIAILSAALDDPTGVDLQALKLEAAQLDLALEAVWEDIQLMRSRRRALRDAIAAASEKDTPPVDKGQGAS